MQKQKSIDGLLLGIWFFFVVLYLFSKPWDCHFLTPTIMQISLIPAVAITLLLCLAVYHGIYFSFIGEIHEFPALLRRWAGYFLERYYKAPRMYTLAVLFLALTVWQHWFRFEETFHGPPEDEKIRIYDKTTGKVSVYDSCKE
jgi:hypothetical protein